MKKRLKIAEQILIVLSLALILPLIIASAIIINTNQIAVRKELEASATIIANSIENELSSFLNSEKSNLFYYIEATRKMGSTVAVNEFADIIKADNPDVFDFSTKQLPRKQIVPQAFSSKYIPDEKKIILSYVDKSNLSVTKTVSEQYVFKNVFHNFNPQGRQIYILDKNKNLIHSYNVYENNLSEILEVFPKEILQNEPTNFYKYKNQPNILTYIPELEWYIIVASPKDLTSYGIVEARSKIIISICIAAIAVFAVFGIYTYYLYTNIRQFFKVIKSISDGNYNRKLRFLTTPFTSQEVFFISDEFNKMLEKIDESYKKLQENNLKLKKMDEYKSDLIDTVSHEFRTPLTSIKGYTSSMLRHDINIDDETKKKSLKIIKQQAERLSRMVEDLLVIPDIESATIRMNYKEVNLKNIIETSILYTSRNDTSIFDVNIQEPLNNIYADEDRLIQILINLLENALKYSKENTQIKIFAFSDNNKSTIKVHNESEYIDREKLNELFEKFTRIDSKLTRTTRGTGLGLFIVKGLVETMGGEISLNADNGFEVTFSLPTYKGQNNADA